MFINAVPRFVSNGFETFVPRQRAESLHQRLVDMANNDANARGVFGPVASPASDNWYQYLDGFNLDENFPAQKLYAASSQHISSPAYHSQAGDFPKPASYSTHYQGQAPAVATYSMQQMAPHLEYQQPAAEMSYFNKPSPMLGNDYDELSRRGSFAEFSRSRNVLRHHTYEAPDHSGATLYGPISSSGLLPSSFAEDVDLNACVNADRASPSTVYSSYSPTVLSARPPVGERLNSPATEIQYRWPIASHINRDQSYNPYELPWSDNGLPRALLQSQQQQHGELWKAQHYPNTISPTDLTRTISPAPLSSSASSHGSMLAMSDNAAIMLSPETTPPYLGEGEERRDFSVVEMATIMETQYPGHQQRQALPDSKPYSHRTLPVLPSNNFAPHRNTEKRSMKEHQSHKTRSKNSPSRNVTATFSPSLKKPRDTVSSISRPSAPKRIEPKPSEQEAQQSCNNIVQAPVTAQAMQHRDAKDDFLVRSKLAGMSYKDIRRQGKFTEAESTLRGRFRTLTKHKAARVRKPEWSDNDIRLLKKAVRKLTPDSGPTLRKIPWKQVAEYIASHGGSYHFGNATCRKRWDELEAQTE